MKLSNQEYTKKFIAPFFEPLIVQLLLKKPLDPANFMSTWINREGMKVQQKLNQDHSDEQNDEEFLDEKDIQKIKMEKQGSRVGVSAQAYGEFNQKGNFQVKQVPKSEDQTKRIRSQLEASFMFQHLGQAEQKSIVSAMEEQKKNPGDEIITQGAQGNCLYLIDQGELDCYRTQKKGEEPKLIQVYKPGEAFGQLALLYNAPRAATIKAQTKAVLFKLDRETFNHFVKDAAIKQRERYEDFLKQVELLKELSDYQRLQIADALVSKDFKKGDKIINEGEGGDLFFFLEKGQCQAIQNIETGKPPQKVMEYQPGEYFGELALLKNSPRAASVVAVTETTVAILDQKSFDRLIGPLEDILKRNFSKYEKYM